MIQIIINDIANKVRAALLTGLSTATNATIAATDSVLVAFGKLQAQITAHVNNTSNPHATTATQVDALKRDGSNANSDISVDAYSVNAKSFHAKGTGGNGHIGLKHQSSNITASGSESSLGANNSGNPVWKNDGNAIQSIMLENTAIVAATKTKITYDAKGLVTSGADATTADINDSSNRRYVTDAQQTVLGNTSGTNTGDDATNSQYSGLSALITQKTGQTAYITTGDITTTSNVAFNITGMVFTLEANKRYRVMGVFRTSCNNTGGILFGSNAPAGAVVSIFTFGNTNLGTAYTRSRIIEGGVLTGVFNTANSANFLVYMMGEIETSATAGNIQFIFASGVNTQLSTISKTGSWLNIVEL